MSRANSRDQSDKFSLFPFLAVLLCTMGALLILLVGLAKAARDRVAERQEATEQAVVEAASITADQAEQLAEIEQYVAQLDTVRQTAAERLREDKARLSHLEDHMRRLKEELGNLQIAAMELEAMNSEHDDDRAQAESELERLRGLINEAEKRIEKLQAEQRGRGKSYAIVPYAGRNGTTRPTIYIECRKDRVILQPEGVELKPSDFRPPLGAGNPLAAAIRSAREYLAHWQPVAPGETLLDPYPLILVRPNGVAAYYKVRDALRGWESDFGYELVGADWNLTYPTLNPELARCEMIAIEDARARRRLLAAAAPSAYGGADAAFDVDEESQEPGAVAMVGSGSGSGAGLSNGTVKSAVLGGVEAGVSGGFSPDGNPDLAELGTTEAAGNGPSAFDVAASGEGGEDSTAAQSGKENGRPANEQTAGDQGSTETDRSARASEEINFGETGNAPPTASQGLAAETGQSGPSSTGNSTSAKNSAQAAAAAQMGAADAESSGSTAKLELNSQPGQVRGKDWAIRNSAPANVAIRRNVQVVIRAEQLAILPDRAQIEAAVETPRGKSIALAQGRAIPVDKFVASLWDHIDQWGMAGNGLYWKPVLVLNVAPGGEQRAAELSRLLHNSGVEVRASDTAQHNERDDHATPR